VSFLQALQSPDSGRGRWLIVALVTACLLPFAGKAFHIDDPVYVWVAQRIVEAPFDFYGFELNWHGFMEPVATLNKNPPGVGFVLALVGAVAGWSELAMHLALMPFAVGLVLGVRRLAEQLGGSPLLAAIAAWTMPAVLVSATTVMADVPMLALWCWALSLWIDGVRSGRGGRLACAALLAGLCPLFKYFGLAVLSLMAAYAALYAPRRWTWVPHWVGAQAIVGLFDVTMRLRYGHSPFGEVGAYALSYRAGGPGPVGKAFVGLAFLGGCLLSGLFFAPLLWSRRACILALCGVAGATLGIPLLGVVSPPSGESPIAAILAFAQLALFGAVGLQWLVLAGVELHRDRSAEAWLLGLWLSEVFVFAAFLNWSTSARAVLPAAPAAAILLARRLASSSLASARPPTARWAVALAPALAVALTVAWADARLAETARTAARDLVHRYAAEADGRVWFRGAWGFQFYAMTAQARKVDDAQPMLEPGDVLLLPKNNTGVLPAVPGEARRIERVQYPAAGWIATMSPRLGAGFYSDLYGPLPFAFGPAPPEVYRVYRVEGARTGR
jgi:4-amino-4-deoxy-L-arabinose transferase-like glycosyltransferase